MQPPRRVLLLFLVSLSLRAALAAPPKAHTVAFGPIRKVAYIPPDATADTRGEEATTLKVRPLSVDGAMKEWTVGEFHDVTDRTFVIRRALRINDALPGEASRWSWQPGPWLSVDRVTGHITALHLPDFDPEVSEAVWFRDYAAYCGLHVLVKSTALTGIVFQLGARRPAVSQKLASWPMNPIPHPACAATTWQRVPIRATLRPTGMTPVTFDLLGTTSLVEDGEEATEGPRE